MALHDYRRMIDIHGGGYLAVEITTDDEIDVEIGYPSGRRESTRIDAPTAGVFLDAIAGAIRELEGLVPPALEQATRDAYAGGEQPIE